MSDYSNNNGLVAGLIPAGKPCPFLDKCKFKVHTCPGVDDKVKPVNFSCAAARLHSAIAEAPDAPGFQAMARGIVEKGAPLFEIRKRPIRLSFSTMQAVKEEDKEK